MSTDLFGFLSVLDIFLFRIAFLTCRKLILDLEGNGFDHLLHMYPSFLGENMMNKLSIFLSYAGQKPFFSLDLSCEVCTFFCDLFFCHLSWVSGVCSIVCLVFFFFKSMLRCKDCQLFLFGWLPDYCSYKPISLVMHYHVTGLWAVDAFVMIHIACHDRGMWRSRKYSGVYWVSQSIHKLLKYVI